MRFVSKKIEIWNSIKFSWILKILLTKLKSEGSLLWHTHEFCDPKGTILLCLVVITWSYIHHMNQHGITFLLIPYNRLISRGEIFVDWIVKTFWGIQLNKPINSIIFVVKISRTEQNLQKPQNFYPLKFICYMVFKAVPVRWTEIKLWIKINNKEPT